METRPGEGVVKEEKFPNSRKPSHRRVCGSFGISEGNKTGRQTHTHTHTHTHTKYVPNCNCQWRSSPGARIRHQGLDKEARAASLVLRVRTGPECPKDNLRELT